MYARSAGAGALDPEGAIQAWIFQQFLMLLVLTPVAGAMSVAAYSVIGEKQARTLEPLLATPITTFELLAAKVLGSLLPSLALTVVCFAIYVVGVAAASREPGVFRVLLTHALAGHRLPARAAGVAGGAAAGGLRVVARQRRAQRAADWRADHPADDRACSSRSCSAASSADGAADSPDRARRWSLRERSCCCGSASRCSTANRS